MTRWQKHFPLSYALFMKIAEPRVLRLLYLGIYLSMVCAGWGLMAYPPSQFKDIIGWWLVEVFGLFLLMGGLLAGFAVLPGLWWVERVGLIFLITGMAVYVVLIINLHASPIGVSVAIAFILSFIIRWIGIRRYQLAPREE